MKDSEVFLGTIVCAETLTVFAVCLFLAFLASPHSTLTDNARYRMTALLPLLMLCASFILPPVSSPDSSQYEFAADICLAFAVGFSMSNLRIKGRYSIAIGVFFLLLCASLLFIYIKGLLWRTANYPP